MTSTGAMVLVCHVVCILLVDAIVCKVNKSVSDSPYIRCVPDKINLIITVKIARASKHSLTMRIS